MLILLAKFIKFGQIVQNVLKSPRGVTQRSMKIRELTPGLYKIRRQVPVPFGAKHRRMNVNAVQLLRVQGAGEHRLYFIDHETYGQRPEDVEGLDQFEIMSKYEGDPQIANCRITIHFTDSSGQSFSFSVGDAWSLRGMFESLAWLKRPFGFLEAKKRK